jgi:phage shock protein C
MALSDELNALGELRARGTLTEEEFAKAKARLLNEGHAAAPPEPIAAVNGLRRTGGDRWIGGVCGGLARSTGMEAWAWRLIFTVFVLAGGAGLLLYLLLWIFVPAE